MAGDYKHSCDCCG